MKDLIKDFWLGMPVGMYVILILSFALLCVSFAIPPLGVISSSSLQGAALILGATWLFYTTTHIPSILSKGAKIKASYGNAQIEIGRKREKEHPEETFNVEDEIENIHPFEDEE